MIENIELLCAHWHVWNLTKNRFQAAEFKVHTTNRLIMLTIKVKSELNILASERKNTEKWAAGKFLGPSYFETTLVHF